MFFTTSLLIFVAEVVSAAKIFLRLKNTTAIYNRRLLPFARFSLSSWIVWMVQYLILPGPSDPPPTELLLITGLWLGVVQNTLWISAAFSLRSKQFPRISDRLLFFIIFPIVLVFAVGTYRIGILTSAIFLFLEVVATAVSFAILAHSIWQWRLSQIYVVLFSLHGYTQWIWRSLWFGPLTGKWMAIYWAFPVWRIVLLFAWIRFISSILNRAESSSRAALRDIERLGLPKSLDTITVNIGSTVEDLGEERQAAAEAIRRLRMTELSREMLETSSEPLRDVYTLLAEECHIFILIVGERYGSPIEAGGISVTEFQYQVARQKNPEKILVYVKDDVIREPRLHDFLTRVQEAEHIDIRSFITPEELFEKIQRGIADWLTVHGKQLK